MSPADLKGDTLHAETRPSTPNARSLADARVPALIVIAHPDRGRIGHRAHLIDLLEPGREVAISRLAPDLANPQLSAFAPLGDAHLSRKPVVLRRTKAGYEVDASGTSTRVSVAGQDVATTVTIPDADVDRGVVIGLAGRVGLLLREVGRPTPVDPERYGMLGISGAIERIRGDVERVADTEASVLVRGESGTGKELVAAAIHARSRRAGGALVSVNMGSIPQALAASQLFGHKQGAFSGANRAHRGFFSQARGGTLFLDEIGETPAEVQVMLLRSIETGDIRPVGGERVEKTDVRLVTATDKDLEAATQDGSFRLPLYHRLAGFVIDVPPLRDRREDVALLLHAFLDDELTGLGEAPLAEREGWLDAGLVQRLVDYRWPGNVRELRNAARQIAIASRGAERAVLGVYLERLLTRARADATAAADAAGEPEPARRPSSITEDELIEALRANRWKIAPTAAQLGMARASLYDMINRSDRIRKANELTAADITAARDAVGGDVDTLAEALEVSARGLLFRIRQLGLE